MSITEIPTCCNNSSSITSSAYVELSRPSDSTINDNFFLPWDNPDNIISLSTYNTISMVSNCVLYPTLFLIGLPSNWLNCIVFWRQGLKDRMNLCLFCLALVDLTYLVVLIVQAASTFVSFVDQEIGAEYYAKSLVYCLGVGWGLKAASGCISMVIAVERCLCVVRPLHVESLMRTSTMGWLLLVIVAGTQLAQVVQPMAYTANKALDIRSGRVHWNIGTTQFYADNKVLLDFILVVFLPFIIPVITFIVVAFTTAVTVVRLSVASQQRKEMTLMSQGGHHDPQANLTLVLVLLSCVYITCTAPLVAVTLVRLLVPEFSPEGRYSNICIATHMLGTVSSAINSAVNFFVYVHRSSRFRQTLRALCNTRMPQKRK